MALLTLVLVSSVMPLHRAPLFALPPGVSPQCRRVRAERPLPQETLDECVAKFRQSPGFKANSPIVATFATSVHDPWLLGLSAALAKLRNAGVERLLRQRSLSAHTAALWADAWRQSKWLRSAQWHHGAHGRRVA